MLEINNLKRLARVNRFLRVLSSENEIWREKWLKKHPNLPLSGLGIPFKELCALFEVQAPQFPFRLQLLADDFLRIPYPTEGIKDNLLVCKWES